MKKLTLAIMLTGVLGINQAVAANAILINEWVKAGVNETTGTFGSGGNTPPGLQYDGTGTGTFNNSYDYLTPGSPFDGFSVRLDATGTNTYVNNNAGGMAQISGAWVSTPTSASAVWAGSVAGKFDLQNTYSLPSGQQYIDINTQITMNSNASVLWFGRFIDPDARAAAGDSSATDNVLGYGAIPRTNVAFSEATVSRYALGMYSAATNVGAGIARWSTDPEVYFNNHASGYGSYTADTYGRGDDTIGLGFKVSGVTAGDVVTFNYAYIFGPSAFGAASTAVAGGAGGGTAGTVPGGGTLVDVGSATSAATSGGSSTPPAPTVTGTSTSTITISDVTAISATLPVITASLAHHEASEATGVQTIARETTTNVTTPIERTLVTKVRTTSTWSDSTTTFVDASPVTAVTVSNSVATSVANDSFSGRVDQYEQLAELNTGINRSLNSQLFRKDMVDGKGYRMYMGAAHLDSSAGNGYDAKSDKFNIGVEKDVKEYWTLGAQFTRVNTSLDGVDSDSKQNKNHYGAYSILTRNDWILKTDLGLADNSLKSNRNVAGLFYNASSTDGNDWWLSNRVYTPSLKGFRPYAGYTYGKDKRDAYTETGSVQSYRTVASVTETNDYTEIGVRYDKTINKLILSGEAGVSSDSYKDIKGEVSYLVNPRSRISITASRQEHKDLSTNQIGLFGKIDF
jgi:hypothetical protein